jgi:hypothetical protein
MHFAMVLQVKNKFEVQQTEVLLQYNIIQHKIYIISAQPQI